jgi:spoIIIJ-associated protein
MGSAEDASTRIEDVLTRFADDLGVEADVKVSVDEDGFEAEFVGDDLGAIIGHQGGTLDAIQHLVYRIAFRGASERRPLSVDAGGYRARRAKALRALGDQAAESAIREQRPVALDPMPALERKVVHEHLKARWDVETYSEGQEPGRYLVVAPVV